LWQPDCCVKRRPAPGLPERPSESSAFTGDGGSVRRESACFGGSQARGGSLRQSRPVESMENAMSTPAGSVPAEPRKGFHLPVWLVVVVGVLLVGGAAFLVGRGVSRRRERVGFGGRFDSGHVGHPILWIFVAGIVIALTVAGVVALVRHYSAPPAQSAIPGA